MDRQRRATIIDVAREANVSIKTVSRVLNNEPRVRPATRDRVQAAAASLQYHPNVIAQRLVGRRSYLLGMIYENPSPSYVVDLQLGALDRLRDERYHLVVLPVESIDRIADDIVQLLRSAALDGVMLPPPASDNPTILNALETAHFPVVRIAPTTNLDNGVNYTTDDVAATRALMAYLVGLGHRRIGMIQGDPSHPSSTARTEGYRIGLQESGIAYAEELIRPGMFNFDSGLESARALLALPNRPTAIFAQNDDMAAGVIAAAHDLGIAMPAELSIIGFDDSAIACAVYPRLTTIHQPVREMARSAADGLVALVEGKSYSACIGHPWRLIERDSVGPAPAR
jgi:LacI family transcriptional regulator